MADQAKFFNITFQPLGLRDRFCEGESIHACIRQAGIDLVSLCNAKGSCGKCRIQIVEGEVSPPTKNEKKALGKKLISHGYRLACQSFAQSDLVVNVPAESLSAPQRLQVEGKAIPFSPDPLVAAYEISLAEPTLTDLRGDDIRVMEALSAQHHVFCETIDDSLLGALGSRLRSAGWQVSAVVRQNEVIAITSPDKPTIGLAVDLGTTKMAAYLVDLQSGHTLAAKGVMNPQIAYGEDVIARIVYARKSSEATTTLQTKVVEALNRLSADLCREAACDQSDIQEMVVVGNTAMHHLLLKLPLDHFARAPYVPVVSGPLDIKARKLGLVASDGAYVHLLPNIAAFVGADHVAMLEGCQAWEAKGPLLAVDIGTNTEISLAVDGDITSVSCASGPAFEGAHISHGMRAAPGAIEHFKLLGRKVVYHTIGGAKPSGICGSGIFDILAQLFINGIIDDGGRILENHPRVTDGTDNRRFIIADKDETANDSAIAITQQDVRELQLAKAAIQSGIEVLLKDRKIAPEDLAQIVVAGAFGNYLDLSSVMAIGLFPKLPLERFRQVGNAAGVGAKITLVSKPRRLAVQKLTRRIRYVEMAGLPDFNDIYVKALSLGPKNDFKTTPR